MAKFFSVLAAAACLLSAGCGGGSGSVVGSSSGTGFQPAGANPFASPLPSADATQARFFAPQGIALAPNGDLYVADTGNRTIRKIAANGVVSTIAGTPGVQGSADGIGRAASFTEPRSIALDAQGNLFVTDGSAIRKITPARVVSTIAGTQGVFGSVDGIGTAARFRTPDGIAADALGNLYVADTAGTSVRRISANGVVTTLAGLDVFSPGTQTPANPARAPANLAGPRGIVLDALGNLLITDVALTPGSTPGTTPALARGFSTVRRITPAGAVSLVAGGGAQTVSLVNINNVGEPALFAYAYGIAVDAFGGIYVADGWPRIQKIAPDGTLFTLPVLLENPLTGLAIDAQGNLIGSDTFNDTIVKIAANGSVTVLAGRRGAPGSADTR